MTWTNENSPPEEVALERAWSALNHALDRRVRIFTQMRVTACAKDALSFMTLLRELEAAEIRRWDEQKAKIAELEVRRTAKEKARLAER